MGWIGWKSATLGTVAGGVCAMALYSSLAGGAPPASTLPVLAPVSTATPSTVYADCAPPAVLAGDECVTHVTRTITPSDVPAVPAVPGGRGTVAVPALPARTAAPAGTSSATTPAGHDDDHDGGHDDDHDGDDGDGPGDHGDG